jgi:outer membrane protein OmpA-like peptidoglycan-associated protein
LDARTIGDIASRLSAPIGDISQGLKTSIATLLGGIASRVGDSTWTSELFKLVSMVPSKLSASDVVSAAVDPTHASFATRSLMDSGRKLLSFAFGGNQSSVFDAVARSTGLSSGAVQSLMGIAAPLMLTALGRQVREGNLNATELGKALSYQADDTPDLLPPGVSRLFGAAETTIPSSSSLDTPTSIRPIKIDRYPEPPVRRSRAWLWFIPLLLVLCLFWLYRARHPIAPVTVVVPVRVLHPITAPNVPSQTLSNIPRGSIASQLLAFIQDPTKSVDLGTRFDSDRLLFAPNSAVFGPGAREQLVYVASILKAYPNVHLMIGGHTDNTGTAGRNLKLSQDRANAVREQLVAIGVSRDRLQTQGFGAQYPVADNFTAGGRALNRRTSMTVTLK